MGKEGGNDAGRKCVEVKEMEEAKALLPYGMVSARRIKGEPSRFAHADGTRVGRRPRGGGGPRAAALRASSPTTFTVGNWPVPVTAL